MRTYTPGFFGLKIIAFIISFAVCIIGLIELWYPISLIQKSGTIKGSIVRVEKVMPGFQTQIYSTMQDIPEEKNRSAVFYHYVEFLTKDRELNTAKLNVASVKRPQFSVGSSVRVAYDPDKPEVAISTNNLSTWAVGFFVLFVGLSFAVASYYMAFYAKKPIELPEDTPEEDPGKVAPHKKETETASA